MGIFWWCDPLAAVSPSRQFERRMESLLAYRSQYGATVDGAELFPDEAEIRERLASTARLYGNLIGVRYGESFVVKETLRVDDVVTIPVRRV